ncbi:hypothetical protein Q0M94_12100 [Deinococcus radiomollis]|uniref:hypothetical protein n=1 Tax=Deinococcus radiomollis TaxID=468916 RepID=UPI00389192FE
MPETTICARTVTLLAAVGPLTPKQVRIALAYPAAGAILQHLVEMGRVQPVSATSRQRQASGGQGSAYALIGHS